MGCYLRGVGKLYRCETLVCIFTGGGTNGLPYILLLFGLKVGYTILYNMSPLLLLKRPKWFYLLNKIKVTLYRPGTIDTETKKIMINAINVQEMVLTNCLLIYELETKYMNYRYQERPHGSLYNRF